MTAYRGKTLNYRVRLEGWKKSRIKTVLKLRDYSQIERLPMGSADRMPDGPGGCVSSRSVG